MLSECLIEWINKEEFQDLCHIVRSKPGFHMIVTIGWIVVKNSSDPSDLKKTYANNPWITTIRIKRSTSGRNDPNLRGRLQAALAGASKCDFAAI